MVYRKSTERISAFQELIKQYFPRIKHYTLYTDQTRDSLAYKQMKEDISSSEATVFMMDVQDLAASSLDQVHEIDWFLGRPVSCIFFAYPTMLEHPEHNPEQLGLLREYLKNGAYKKQVLPMKQVVRKKRIDYPDGWEDLFDQWERKEITAREFMKLCGLKRGTFYHMVADYKAQKYIMKMTIDI